MTDPLDVQCGGDHYKNLPIQPIEYTMANGLNFCQGNIIKYVTRYKDKNGVEDLLKVKHYIDLLISFEYPETVLEDHLDTYEEDWDTMDAATRVAETAKASVYKDIYDGLPQNCEDIAHG